MTSMISRDLKWLFVTKKFRSSQVKFKNSKLFEKRSKTSMVSQFPIRPKFRSNVKKWQFSFNFEKIFKFRKILKNFGNFNFSFFIYWNTIFEKEAFLEIVFLQKRPRNLNILRGRGDLYIWICSYTKFHFRFKRLITKC